MPPKVSIVIPTYNSAPLLKKALDSVQNQNLKDFEVIVINNYSEDNTVEVVDSFKDLKIKLVNFHNDGVIGKSRNIGIKESRGEWVAFLDSDDLWYTSKLEECLKAIKQYPEADLFAHKLRTVLGSGEIIGVSEIGSVHDNMHESLLFQGSRFATSSVVARKSLLEKVNGFSERSDFSGVEDYDLWLRLSKLGKFHFIDSVLGDYTIHESNFSADVKKRVEHWTNVLEEHFKELPLDKRLNGKIKSSKAEVKFSAGWNNLKMGNFSEARKWFYSGLKMQPFHFKSYIGIFMAILRLRVSSRIKRLAFKVNNLTRRMS
jgi:glycosyltransferase involved in cell wall biosynthesis